MLWVPKEESSPLKQEEGPEVVLVSAHLFVLFSGCFICVPDRLLMTFSHLNLVFWRRHLCEALGFTLCHIPVHSAHNLPGDSDPMKGLLWQKQGQRSFPWLCLCPAPAGRQTIALGSACSVSVHLFKYAARLSFPPSPAPLIPHLWAWGRGFQPGAPPETLEVVQGGMWWQQECSS